MADELASLSRPLTAKEYLALCSGTGNAAGKHKMSQSRVLQCYGVTSDDYNKLITEVVEYLAGNAELLSFVRESQGNNKEWRLAKAELLEWLEQHSTWATDERFGNGNNTVPDACKKEAIHRVVKDVRDEITHNYSKHGLSPPPFKLEADFNQRQLLRSATVSPARSIRSATSIAAGQLRLLQMSDSESMATITSIRSCNISYSTPGGQPVKRVTMKAIVRPDAFEQRDKVLTATDVDYERLLSSAASVTGLEKDQLLFAYNGDTISSQHELEAAINDFTNGIRQSNNLDITVDLKGTEQGWKGMDPLPLSTARSQMPRTTSPVAEDNTPKPRGLSDTERERDNAGSSNRSGSHGDKVDLSGETSRGRKPNRRVIDDFEESDGNNSSSAGIITKKKGRERSNEKAKGSKTSSIRSRTSSVPQSPPSESPVEYGELPQEDPELMDDDIDGGLDDDMETRFLEYMERRLGEMDAGFKAMRVTKEEWESAASTFGIPLKRLAAQWKADRFIGIDPKLGLNPLFKLMAHQAVGADVIHGLIFGPLKGCVEADFMGLGKTVQIIVAFSLNFVITFEANNNGARLPSDQPVHLDKDGLFKGRSPRIGATFLSAYSNGIEPWPRDWTMVMKDSRLLKDAPEAYRPKMIVLHDIGRKLCEKYGGEEVGLYSDITTDDLYQMLPNPDWDKARMSFSDGYELENGRDGAKVKYTAPSKRADNPLATTSKPAPSSVRYFIVSTNKSWKTRVYDVIQTNFKAVREINSQIASTPATHTGIRRDLIARRRTTINMALAGGGDGQQRYQATRQAVWRDQAGNNRSITMVCDLLYAGWVVVDEIHSAGRKETLTYSHVIDPFSKMVSDPALRPAFTAITGSAMANGIITILTFALKAFRRDDPAWKKLPVTAVKLLQQYNLDETLKAWSKFEKASSKERTKSLEERINSNAEIANILNVFADIIGTYFVARDYNSVDLYGRKLNLLDCELREQYLPIVCEKSYHEMLKEVEDNMQTKIKEAHKEAVEAWEEDGGDASGQPKPKPKSAERVDSKSYQKAKVLASFPNFYNAIREYQEAHPNAKPLIGDQTGWGDDLGKLNLRLEEIFKSPENIINSMIYKAIDSICRGSAKMDHILHKAEATSSEMTTAPHPEKKQHGETIEFQSKYCIASNVRLCKAIVYARMVKKFGPGKIAWVGEGTQKKEVEVSRWRKTWDPETESADDEVCFMVAALKMVCQSIDLVEGHVFECLEPHTINAEAVQYGYRGYRIGQPWMYVEVNHLLHSGSYVEEMVYRKNMNKNKFAEQCRSRQLDKIKQLAAEEEVEEEVQEV